MAFLRKTGNMLGKTLSSHINQEITSSKSSIFQPIRCMPNSKLFIGGLSYSTDDTKAFSKNGEVTVEAGNMLGKTPSWHFNFKTSDIMSNFRAIKIEPNPKLFVGGLSRDTDKTSLLEAFSKYGEVTEAEIYVNLDTGGSAGCGNVTYASVDEASAAIQALNKQELHGHRISVSYAIEKLPDVWGGGYDGDGQNLGATGGAGGSSDAGGSQFASSGQEGFGDTFGTEQSNPFGRVEEGFSQDEPLEGNDRDDDDTPGNYVDRRGLRKD